MTLSVLRRILLFCWQRSAIPAESPMSRQGVRTSSSVSSVRSIVAFSLWFSEVTSFCIVFSGLLPGSDGVTISMWRLDPWLLFGNSVLQGVAQCIIGIQAIICEHAGRARKDWGKVWSSAVVKGKIFWKSSSIRPPNLMEWSCKAKCRSNATSMERHNWGLLFRSVCAGYRIQNAGVRWADWRDVGRAKGARGDLQCGEAGEICKRGIRWLG